MTGGEFMSEWREFIDDLRGEPFRIQWARTQNRASHLWWSLKCRMWHRFNRLHIKTLHPTGADARDVMVHAAFTVLTNYIEEVAACGYHYDAQSARDELAKPEDRPGDHDWLKHALPALETQEQLYRWWTVDRVSRHREAGRRLMEWHRMPMGPEREAAWERLQELSDDVLDTEDDAMLHKLIDVRRGMWT